MHRLLGLTAVALAALLSCAYHPQALDADLVAATLVADKLTAAGDGTDPVALKLTVQLGEATSPLNLRVHFVAKSDAAAGEFDSTLVSPTATTDALGNASTSLTGVGNSNVLITGYVYVNDTGTAQVAVAEQSIHFNADARISSQNSSSLSLSPASGVADGISEVMLTVQVRNNEGVPLADQPVTFAVLGAGAELSLATASTDANGVATSVATSTLVGTKQFTVATAALRFAQSANFAMPASCSTTLMLPSLPMLTSFAGLSSVALGHFNGDGIVDVAAGSGNANTFTVFLGKKNTGIFNASANYTMPSDVTHVATSDINADGYMDVQYVSANANAAFIVYANTDGTFRSTSPVRLLTQNAPSAIVAADFNGDGLQDVAVSANSVNIFLQSGSGNFLTTPIVSAVGPGFTGLTLGDFNNDGKPDIVAVSKSAAIFSALLNDGTGHLLQGTANSAVGAGAFLVSGDLDHDGNTDVVLSQAGNVLVFSGLGDGNFTSPVTSAVSGVVGGLGVADMDGDGRLDVVVGSTGGTLSVLLGRGAGTFAAPVNYTSNTNVIGLALGDLNGDQKIDVVAANNATGAMAPAVVPVVGNGDGTLRVANVYPSRTTPTAVAALHLNVDTQMDFVVATADGVVTAYAGRGDGTFSNAGAVYAGSGNQTNTIAIADFNNDAKSDLAITNASGTSVQLLLWPPTGMPATATGFATAGSPSGIAAADFTGDGNIDLAVVGPTNPNVYIYAGAGNGNFKAAQIYGAGASPYAVIAADFDGNGLADLAVSNTGSLTVTVSLNNGLGAFGPPVSLQFAAAPYGLAAGDFNADGKLDLAAVILQRVVVYAGSGSGTFTQLGTYPARTLGASPLIAADFTGDGYPDIAVSASSTAGFHVTVLANTAGIGFGTPQVYPSGDFPNGMAVADFNNDTHPDLVLINSVPANACVLLQSGCSP